MNRLEREIVDDETGVPRMRGDEPLYRWEKFLRDQRSPHARG